MTVVDTAFMKGDDQRIIFFRTRNTYSDGVFHPGGGNIDQIGAAVYHYDMESGTGEMKLGKFEKWLFEQSTNGHTPKPRLLEYGDGPPIVVITSEFVDHTFSGTGQVTEHDRTDHFFSIPELEPVLEIRTLGSIQVGNEAYEGSREWKVVRDENDWKEYPDIEVTTRTKELKQATTEIWQWSEVQQKYVLKPKTTVKPGAARPAPARKP